MFLWVASVKDLNRHIIIRDQILPSISFLRNVYSVSEAAGNPSSSLTNIYQKLVKLHFLFQIHGEPICLVVTQVNAAPYGSFCPHNSFSSAHNFMLLMAAWKYCLCTYCNFSFFFSSDFVMDTHIQAFMDTGGMPGPSEFQTCSAFREKAPSS